MEIINLTSDPITIQLNNNEHETINPLGVTVDITPRVKPRAELESLGNIEVIEADIETYFDKNEKDEILNKIADELGKHEADVALVSINVLRAMRRTAFASNVLTIDTSSDSAIRDNNGELIAVKRLLGNAF